MVKREHWGGTSLHFSLSPAYQASPPRGLLELRVCIVLMLVLVLMPFGDALSYLLRQESINEDTYVRLRALCVILSVVIPCVLWNVWYPWKLLLGDYFGNGDAGDNSTADNLPHSGPDANVDDGNDADVSESASCSSSSHRSSPSVEVNCGSDYTSDCGSDYTSDCGSSGDSTVKINERPMVKERSITTVRLSASIEPNGGSDETSGSSDDSSIKGHESPPKTPSSLDNIPNCECDDSDSGDSIK